MAELGPNRYGKEGIRLVKVSRRDDRHDLRDLTVDVVLEGDFRAAHLEGDNRAVLPTDTMRNTVYAFARQREIGEIEEFGLTLAAHFVEEVPAVSRAHLRLVEHRWQRIVVGGEPHRHAFRLPGRERRTATVINHGEAISVEAGIEDLWVTKCTGSAFLDFYRDPYTTLPDAEDRLLATVLAASWVYEAGGVAFGRLWEEIRRVLLETFATHDDSRSVQHTAHAMGEAVLESHPEVRLVRLSLPNKHHLTVDLSPFGLDNPDEVLVATDRPYGLIEVTVKR